MTPPRVLRSNETTDSPFFAAGTFNTSSTQHAASVNLPCYFYCYLPARVGNFLPSTVAEADVEQDTCAMSCLVFGFPNRHLHSLRQLLVTEKDRKSNNVARTNQVHLEAVVENRLD